MIPPVSARRRSGVDPPPVDVLLWISVIVAAYVCGGALRTVTFTVHGRYGPGHGVGSWVHG